MAVKEQAISPDVLDYFKGVCHFRWEGQLSPNAVCGATPAAWADCPFEDYCGDSCKCGKPDCQLCEIVIASGL